MAYFLYLVAFMTFIDAFMYRMCTNENDIMILYNRIQKIPRITVQSHYEGKNVVIDQHTSILTLAYIFSRLLCRVIGYFLLLCLSLINAIIYLTVTINNAVKNATSISKLKDTSILSPPLTFWRSRRVSIDGYKRTFYVLIIHLYNRY